MKLTSRCNHLSILLWTIHCIIIFSQIPIAHSLTVAVFGGSGFLGRRICQTLVHEGHSVISVSKGGKPSPYYCNDNTGAGNSNWSDKVDWRSHCIHPTNVNESEGTKTELSSSSPLLPSLVDDVSLELPPIDAAISCIGNVNPAEEWDKLTFFGLAFDDTLLFQQNGLVNECAAKIAKRSGAHRFVFLSVSYEVAKMLEGPIDGYMSGKRHAEQCIYDLFGDEGNSIVLGPSLMYGGNRFASFGKLYSQVVRSPLAKGYVDGMNALRELSSTPVEDWVEQSVFSPPVDVRTVARVASSAALGLVSKDLVDSRKQNFFGYDGKPVSYADVVYIDGTEEIERIDGLIDLSSASAVGVAVSPQERGQTCNREYERIEPLWEGALIGKGPFLYPFPVIGVFLAIFGAISTNQFVK